MHTCFSAYRCQNVIDFIDQQAGRIKTHLKRRERFFALFEEVWQVRVNFHGYVFFLREFRVCFQVFDQIDRDGEIFREVNKVALLDLE